MSLFQPTNITPDVRGALGNGTVDADKGMTVSWQVNGANALQRFSIRILENTAESAELYSTGILSNGCPFYGAASDGTMRLFSYTISADALSGAGIVNGGDYKLVITQYWSASDDGQSVTQNSASVFLARSSPAASVAAIGVGAVIDTRIYTFTGNYAQDQGDALNWFRWQIATADGTDEPFFDSGNISGTMDISCTYDGFFTDTDYAVKLSVQTENGVEASSGWVSFSAQYTVEPQAGTLVASCSKETNAVIVSWDGIEDIPGTVNGGYTLSGGKLTLQDGATLTWDTVSNKPMAFAAPWGLFWKGTLRNGSTNILTIGQEGGDLSLIYTFSAGGSGNATGVIGLKKGNTVLASQGGILNQPTVTAVLTETDLYLRVEYMSGGLYPSGTLYPGGSVYPQADVTVSVDLYTLPVSYTQETISSVTLGGWQICDYIEITKGAALASSITAAYTNGNYQPGEAQEDNIFADWTNGLQGGNLRLGNETIQGYSLYRKQKDDSVLVHIADVGSTSYQVYDYGAASQQGPYTYYLYPFGSDSYLSAAFVSNAANPLYWDWSVLQCSEVSGAKKRFVVEQEFRFGKNLSSGNVGNNNQPSLRANFTRYPTVMLSPQQYRSGTLSSLIGVIYTSQGAPRYLDTIAQRDAIYDLSRSTGPLFLKNRKGDLIRIRISGPISMGTGDTTREQTQTVSLPWAEVGSAEGMGVYATENAAYEAELPPCADANLRVTGLVYPGGVFRAIKNGNTPLEGFCFLLANQTLRAARAEELSFTLLSGPQNVSISDGCVVAGDTTGTGEIQASWTNGTSTFACVVNLVVGGDIVIENGVDYRFSNANLTLLFSEVAGPGQYDGADFDSTDGTLTLE